MSTVYPDTLVFLTKTEMDGWMGLVSI